MIYGFIYSVFRGGCCGDSAFLVMHCSATPLPFLCASIKRKESHLCLHRTLLLKKKTLNPWEVRRMSTIPFISVCARAVHDVKFMDSHGSTEMDLLVVGPGVLGRLVAENWLKVNPSCRVYGQTRTMDHHGELGRLGIKPIIKGSDSRNCFPFVIFCAPPSGSEDYPAEVRAATSQWSGEGSFLFTSSSAVYDSNDNSLCLEDSPTVPMGRSLRTDILLMAEAEVLKIGGNVVRLAGLYKLDRGPHMYYLKKGTVDVCPEHIINLIHYEDAASLCKVILAKRYRGHVFMGCDGCPLSRQEMMEEVHKSGKFKEKFKGFTGVVGPLGKRMDNTKTRNEIGWEPKCRSFAEFLHISS